MKKFSPLACAVLAAALVAPMAVHAQNIAVVNGKGVPKERVDMLMKQVTAEAGAQGQQLPPDLEKRVRDKIVMDEIFMQEAQARGIPKLDEYRVQMEMAQQSILIGTLFNDYQKKNPVTDQEIQAEYDKFKAQAEAGGPEYRARHILVEKESDAKALIAQIKRGAKFEDLAKKKSTDKGSGANGGDLDFAKPDTYVPEFAKALMALKKGEMTSTPVKSQFGYHIIRLEDTRQTQFPKLSDVKPQVEQRLMQQKMAAFREEIRKNAKTDYKFSDQPQ
jgi:peptidyl-prolyl cis-trans isomerase C